MAERKVLNKYYPADFDPRCIEQRRNHRREGHCKAQPVRLMTPFTLRCTSCGHYIGKGRTFNAKKERPDEKYLSIQIYRFYIRCPHCGAEVTLKTDPKACGYTCERGAKRNTEPRQTGRAETDDERFERLEEDREKEHDVIVKLEAKAIDTKRDVAVADALDEIRLRNARLEKFDTKQTQAIATVGEEAIRLDEEDEAAAKHAFATRAKRRQETFDTMKTADTPVCHLKLNIKRHKVLIGVKRKEAQQKVQEAKGLRGMPPLVDYNSDSS